MLFCFNVYDLRYMSPDSAACKPTRTREIQYIIRFFFAQSIEFFMISVCRSYSVQICSRSKKVIFPLPLVMVQYAKYLVSNVQEDSDYAISPSQSCNQLKKELYHWVILMIIFIRHWRIQFILLTPKMIFDVSPQSQA